MDIFTLWEHILRSVKMQNPQYYKMFSEQIFPVSFQGNILTLTVSKAYLIGWLKNVYEQPLKTAITSLTGETSPEIIIQTTETQEISDSITPTVPDPDNVFRETPEPFPKNKTEEQSQSTPFDLTSITPKNISEVSLPDLSVSIAQNTPVSAAKTDSDPSDVSDSSIEYNDQTFDNFISAQCNLIAYQAAQEVARAVVHHDYSMSLNPLFIYGPSGLGKTHLLHAIRNYIHENAPDIKSLFITSEGFTNELIRAITKSTQDQVRRKYRTVDILLLDDVQFFSNKDNSALEIFNTFNQLFENKKHIIMTSDRVPEDLKGLEDRLKSRFSTGFIAEISTPDYEICCAILKDKSERESLPMTEDAIDYIASNVNKNIRVLEGAYNNVKMYCKTMHVPINRKNAEIALQSIIKSTQELTVDRIIDTVCSFYSVSRTRVLGPGRPKKIVIPRQVAMYLCRDELGESYPALKEIFHKKDHTSIMYACEKTQKNMEEDPEFKATVLQIKDLLKK